MALTIADAFKLAYENHEKGKADKSHHSSRVAQNDNSDNSQHAKPAVNNGNVEALYATPVKTKAPQLAAPIIQVSGESSSATAVEDSSTKMQALVLYRFDYSQLYLLANSHTKVTSLSYGPEFLSIGPEQGYAYVNERTINRTKE